ncbi:MAG: histone deacetylase [Desulfomonilaceae bacterium]
MKPTGIVRESVYLKHDMGMYHPESPERLEVIYQMLDQLGGAFNLLTVPAREASYEELCLNHDSRYVEKICDTKSCETTFLDPDTSACEYSWEAASKAAGGLFSLIDAVVDSRVRNGFAFVRPPGHHAERRRAMGFCLFNNVALAAHYALTHHKMQRVAIIDWDLHHGNGTQNSFYEDPRVLFLSTHQYPHYPGTGGIREVGHGPGEGFTVNVPLVAGAGDMEYITVFKMLVEPLLDAFMPELILVSAGFDAHEKDPLGGMNLTEDGYEQLIKSIMRKASEFCSGRVVLTLEGGYNITALRNSVKRILLALSTYDPSSQDSAIEIDMESLPYTFRARLRDILTAQGKYWPTLPQIVIKSQDT